MQQSTVLRVAGVKIVLNADFTFRMTERFRPFLMEEAENGIPVQLHTERNLVIPEGSLLAEETSFQVLWNAELGQFRVYYRGMRNREAFAVRCYDSGSGEIRVAYSETNLDQAELVDDVFFHAGWEELLLRAQRLIVHACCISTPYGGILFSGPSGIGKSTQGDLWCQHTDSHVVNGDRPILYQENGSWMAAGSPHAGSSGVYRNEAVPVRAVVMLRQAKTTTIRKMSPRDAIHAIWPGLTVSEWDPELVNLAMNLAEKVSMEVPFYAMDCTPDRDAVEELIRIFEEEKHGK